MNEWTVAEAIANQKKLCEENKYPHFAPYSGLCWSCNQQIYTLHNGKSFITGCPFCNRSYCD